MTPHERWVQVKALFEEALEENPSDVRAWLAQKGVADEELRAEVLSLLRHHTSAGTFLVEPVADRLPELMAIDRRLEPGQVVGKYTIVRELGRGGMGRVYLATENLLKRRVAIKALLPEWAGDPSYRARLRREAQAAAALDDPGICRIYAFEEIDGDLYIVSEFVDGRTLREEIGSGQRPTASLVERTARDLATALASAHRHGITHRDLKPDNVMRTSSGHVKILDFGIARIGVDAGEPESFATYQTRLDAIIGTPAYMAPEQLKGQRADHRADVFAFGLLLYEYASGKHPFDADDPREIPARIVAAETAPIGTWRQDLPGSLSRVIERCLGKSPSDRFPSAIEIVQALDRADLSRPANPLTAWWRTHQLAVIGLYFVACALAWQVKEWRPGIATAIFFAIGIAATVGGFFRGHLLFTERVTGRGLETNRRRASAITAGTDLAIATALVVDGGLLAYTRPVPAIVTVALGVGIALARLVVEPATTEATFGQSAPG